jgi:putative iron-regulated protein
MLHMMAKQARNAVVATALAIFMTPPAAAIEPKAVIATYADIAEAMYGDALSGAKDLQASVDALIAEPSEETLKAARKAWIEARPWYQRTEALRFGNAVVDAWEGRVNAWPLDEGLIDYVDAGSYGEASDENPLYRANVIGSSSIRIGKDEVNVSAITKELLRDRLHEAAGSEANVATGYHAVEFLLWGQDLNGVNPGAGKRPATDFDAANCTNGHCDRRAQYLKAATDLLVDDLAEGRRRGAQGLAGERRSGRAFRHRHRHRQPVLWRTCWRAHEARRAAARPGRGA